MLPVLSEKADRFGSDPSRVPEGLQCWEIPENPHLYVRSSGITPENAPSATFDGVVTNTGNPSVGEVTVTLPLDNVCYIHVWTR